MPVPLWECVVCGTCGPWVKMEELKTIRDQVSGLRETVFVPFCPPHKAMYVVNHE